MSNIQNYLQELAGTIGPRPVGSDTERTAAEWISSAFNGIGLPSEIQDFETNRTTTWSNFLYYLIAILCVLGIGFFKNVTWLGWVLFIIFIIDATGFFIELNGGRLISRILSKGPSQNVIARYTPRTRPGETRRKKVVVVAHYDTLRVSPLTEKSMAKAYSILTITSQYLFFLLPFMCFLMLLPLKFLQAGRTGIWYVALVLCLVPFVLLVDLLLRGALKRFSQGANNNASGVAALLEIAAQLTEGKVDLSDNMKQHTQTMQTVQESFFGGSDSGAFWMPSDELGGSGTSADDFPSDFSWAVDTDGSPATTTPSEEPGTFVPAAPTPAASPAKREANEADFLQFETMDFGVLPQEAVHQPTVSFVPVGDERSAFADDDPNEILGPDLIGEVATQDRYHDFERKTSIFDRIKIGHKKKGRHNGEPANFEDSTDWLGLDDSFDARSAGKEIGSWDNFESGEDDDDGFAWKGGSAGGDILDDYNFASESAARIRRKFSETFEMGTLDEKELWFVATGAFGVHATGMKRFLEAYGQDLRDAFIINVECVGAGQLRWYAEEGAGKQRSAAVRLTSLARRVTRNLDIRAKAAHGKGVSTDATVALKEGFRAITITRLGKDGEPVNWRSMDDTLQDVDPTLIEEAVRFVTGMVREA